MPLPCVTVSKIQKKKKSRSQAVDNASNKTATAGKLVISVVDFVHENRISRCQKQPNCKRVYNQMVRYG